MPRRSGRRVTAIAGSTLTTAIKESLQLRPAPPAPAAGTAPGADLLDGRGPGADRRVDGPVGDGPTGADEHGYAIPVEPQSVTRICAPAEIKRPAVARDTGTVQG